MFGPVASGIGALATGAANLLGLGGNKEKKQFEYQQKLAQQQFQHTQQLNKEAYDRQLDFWNKQNQYNLPINVAERYKAAGMRFDLAGNGSAGYSSPTPSVSNTPYTEPSMPNLANPADNAVAAADAFGKATAGFGHIVDSIKSARQAQLYGSESELVKANLPLVEEKVINYRSLTDLNKFNLKFEERVQNTRAAILAGEYNKIDKQTDVFIKQADLLQQDINRAIYTNQNLLPLQREILEADRSRMFAQTAVYFAQIPLIDAQTANYKASTQLIGKQVDIAEIKRLSDKLMYDIQSDPNFDARDPRSFMEAVMKRAYQKAGEEIELLKQEGRYKGWKQVSEIIRNYAIAAGQVGQFAETFITKGFGKMARQMINGKGSAGQSIGKSLDNPQGQSSTDASWSLTGYDDYLNSMFGDGYE